MTSTKNEDDKCEDDLNEEESESNMLDTRPVRCFPTVKRSSRQNKCNWRWRWKYFTRALQPILEQGESAKDDTCKTDDSSAKISIDDVEKKELSSSATSEGKHLEQKNEQVENYNSGVDFCEEPVESIRDKDDYSACIKLIEKFQEAVLENAVRVIQAAFKRFRERRRFLKLRKAATVIQRSVRQWLMRKHSLEGLEHHLALKGNCQRTDTLQNKELSCSQGKNTDLTTSNTGCDRMNNHNELEDGNCKNEDAFDHEVLTDDRDGILLEESDGTDQFENSNSLDSLDVLSLCGSTDNINDAGISVDPCGEETYCISDPDALSLADSGIDTCSDRSVEATITDESRFLSCEKSTHEHVSTIEQGGAEP